MVSIWLILGCAFCSLESDMLRYTNKFRNEHNMEELYSLPSLQKAADLQVLHMCRKAKLTHDGPSGLESNLAGRLKKFDFVGLNIGENIAKQENDDYREVVKLWMKSEKHRNNILGDYVYSGVATCVGKDGNRYWVQVFGKDVSNTKIAKMRDGMKTSTSKGCDTQSKGGGRPAMEKMHDKKEDFGEEGYIMVIPPEYEKKLQGSREDFEDASDERGSGEPIANQRDVENRPNEGKRIPEIGLDRMKYPGWSFIRRPRSISPHERDRRREERELLSFGDYLIPPHNEGKSQTKADVQSTPYSLSSQVPVSTVIHDAKTQSSTIPTITFVFKDPGNTTIVPALQSLIDAIKGASSEVPSSSKTSSMPPTLYSSSKTSASTTQPPVSSSVQTSSFVTSSRNAISTVTVTTTTHESVTTVYVPKHQVLTTTVQSDRKSTDQPSGRKPSGQGSLGGLPLRLLGASGGGSNGIISPVVRFDGKDGTGSDGEEEGLGYGKICQNGYNKDGTCVASKELDSSKLKDALEDLVRKGKIHLHIVSDEDCEDKEGCYESKNRVDIGIPFSYKL
ncbi:SCP/PR1 domain-containing protein [Encephalitozoon hellem ATCC 50504]|uniref:Cysteine-rich secretory protein n=1 Tax=Encephalitozoon hellem TaxID=27973 RepID=A0A9Q9FB33_ENCHE|nr:SCP/PR1 domain-containing protein [Encephalitozoon hellem ATCC 50504]AFM97986.1 SCP/PR1 domain-containing protein [Encephalitozoon hellem ATCC 50504]UTX42790.1 cysteine-rich secretory protein [Encephalitozoon hellem]|eukprot:XP_003886967.1 SCP/PR1 domain-containing protein [Encephalitozoon hellem ATCC 50504]